MISKKFTPLAVGAALVLSSAFVTPAMAGAECTAADKAQVTQIKGQGARIMDFTNSSVACLDDFASGASHKYLTLVAKSNSQAWRDATVTAAKKLGSEGALVMVAYANDEDGLNTTAETVAWANGVKRSQATISIGGGMNIDHIAHAPDKAVSYIHEKGSMVWDEYLKVPDVAMK